jgi:hypothetical protein
MHFKAQAFLRFLKKKTFIHKFVAMGPLWHQKHSKPNPLTPP